MVADRSKDPRRKAKPSKPHPLMSPGEIANEFQVAPSTIRLWRNSNKLKHIVTPGGHPRYFRKHVEELMRESGFTNLHDEEQ